MRCRCLVRRRRAGEEEGVCVDEEEGEEEDAAVGTVGLGSDALPIGEITLWPEGML